jgi:chorismate synthase
MAGSTFGTLFQVTTFGESHGDSIGAIIQGCPPGLSLQENDIQQELDRRKPGQVNTTRRNESDRVQILSGVYEHKTTGTPIGLLIHNQDARSSDYASIDQCFRPGHASFPYHHKYQGHVDPRGGGRASARETAMRVAAGAIAKKYLAEVAQIEISSFMAQVGPLMHPFSPESLSRLIESLREEGNSIGAKITCIAKHVPIGLGEPVFQKLDAEIAKAMMSIPAAKGIEIGDGFQVVTQKGHEHRDEMNESGFLSNHAGGTLGGLSSGQDIVVHIAFKPTSSIRIPAQTLTKTGESTLLSIEGRHDPCVGLRAAPICEAMLALVLMDAYLLQQRNHRPS